MSSYLSFTLISDWFILVSLTLLELFVFVKLKFKLDFSGKLTLLMHFAVSLIRVFINYQT